MNKSVGCMVEKRRIMENWYNSYTKCSKKVKINSWYRKLLHLYYENRHRIHQDDMFFFQGSYKRLLTFEALDCAIATGSEDMNFIIPPASETMIQINGEISF